MSYELVELKRECEAIEIPSGTHRFLPASMKVRIAQFLGTGYTVVSDYGCMYRIEAKDADALGVTPPSAQEEQAPATSGFSEQMVWDQLRTVYDPEIPVNIADLGLIYSCEITPLAEGGKRVDIKMSMTAPGCGMGNVLKADVESKLAKLPEVKQVNVQVVLDPPWHPGLMSEAAKLQLGFDMDYGSTPYTGTSR
ncbi:MAG TPA: putative Fe-S cluster assembly protein SufT [Terriglobales bacterium]|nr:putative Fe-S cluster assembly protein SufT [Terriglobales bacterium]